MQGLRGLNNLKNLDLGGNMLPNTIVCEELAELPNLVSLDLKNNKLDDHENFLSFFSRMPSILALYLRGNPGIKNLENYRKNIILSVPNLSFLDDRPVKDYERIFATAW